MINKPSLLPARDSWHQRRLSQRRVRSQRAKSRDVPFNVPREVVETAIGTPLALKLPKHKKGGKLLAGEILNLFEIPKTTGVAAIVDDYSALGLALATKHDECQPYLVQFQLGQEPH